VFQKINNLIGYLSGVGCAPLAEILGEREDEAQRQEAAERFRDLILKARSDRSNDQLRIMVKRQGDLWQEGLSIAEMFAKHKGIEVATADDDVEEEADGNREETEPTTTENLTLGERTGDYGGVKWGRYLRALGCSRSPSSWGTD